MVCGRLANCVMTKSPTAFLTLFYPLALKAEPSILFLVYILILLLDFVVVLQRFNFLLFLFTDFIGIGGFGFEVVW